MNFVFFSLQILIEKWEICLRQISHFSVLCQNDTLQRQSTQNSEIILVVLLILVILIVLLILLVLAILVILLVLVVVLLIVILHFKLHFFAEKIGGS